VPEARRALDRHTENRPLKQPPTDIPPELKKEAWAEFEKTLSDYIEQYSKAIDRLLRLTSPSRRPHR
jgi:hypothetical protein